MAFASGRHGAPPDPGTHPTSALWPRMVRETVAAGLFAIVLGGCGAEVGGGGSIVNFPPDVRMERWESIVPGNCKGWLTNVGSHPARDVNVYFRYSTPQGDTVLAFATSSINPGARVVIYVPPQTTRGELRFPHLDGISFSGQSQFPPTGESPPSPGYPTFPCLLSADSARVSIQNTLSRYYLAAGAGLAYHVVLDVETTTGAAEIPLLQNPVGWLWSDPRNCANSASGCDGWGNFHVAVRDSTGIKLLPRLISVRWENYAGVADSLLLPNPYYGYGFGQYGVSVICSP